MAIFIDFGCRKGPIGMPECVKAAISEDALPALDVVADFEHQPQRTKVITHLGLLVRSGNASNVLVRLLSTEQRCGFLQVLLQLSVREHFNVEYLHMSITSEGAISNIFAKAVSLLSPIPRKFLQPLRPRTNHSLAFLLHPILNHIHLTDIPFPHLSAPVP